MTHTLIFDIGKTNKKCFIFDEQHQEVWRTYVHFPEIEDEDGFPCDDLKSIQQWIKKTTRTILADKKWNIKAINFSTYGASFVHLDRKGKVLTPLYNYLKPYPQNVHAKFNKKYGSPQKIARETASPASGMLNSGMQLYWLKETRPKVFNKIQYSLHFPQYLSYLFTGIPLSDFTSIGCHTGLWNYKKKRYHDWVLKENIDRKLAPIVETTTTINQKIKTNKYKIGVGVHDSSAALLPYLWSAKKMFLLLSTGTWSIALNSFSTEMLSKEDLKNDTLNYMRIDGQPVKASRLFLGNEYKLQLEQIRKFYNVGRKAHKQIRFDEEINKQLEKSSKAYFAFESLNVKRKQPKKTQLHPFSTFKIAYHQLMRELVDIQIKAAERAMGKEKIEQIFIDGGFADNDLFVQLLKKYFKGLDICTTKSPLGSALGANLLISGQDLKHSFLKKHYNLKKR